MFRVFISVVSVSVLLFSQIEARSCADVDASFKKLVGEMKESWKEEDVSIEKELSEAEITIIDMEKNIDARMKKLDDFMNSEKDKELNKLKIKHEAEVADLEKASKTFVSKYERDIASNTVRLEKINKDIAEIQIKVTELEKVRDAIDAEYQKASKDKQNENEKIRTVAEDEDRKYFATVQNEYQKQFDGFNAKQEVWEKKEAEKIAIVNAVDKEVENFSVQMANKLGDFQTDLEKRREELSKQFKDAELEAKNMELDMELAKKSEEMNKELTEYRKLKADEKKQREFELDTFRMEKHDFKKVNDAQIASALKMKDDKINSRRNERKRRDEMWEKERLSAENRYKTTLSFKFGKPLELILTRKTALEKESIALTEKNTELRGKASREKDDFMNANQQSRVDGEDIYRALRERINAQYDGKLLVMKQKEEENKNVLEKKRAQLIEKKDKNREKRQTALNKKKEQYEKEKAKCK